MSCEVNILEKVVDKKETSIQDKKGQPPTFDTNLA